MLDKLYKGTANRTKTLLALQSSLQSRKLFKKRREREKKREREKVAYSDRLTKLKKKGQL